MLCLADIREIAELDMTDYALRVVQHDYSPTATVKMNGAVQTAYPRKNWSSMMLMNCEKLSLWTKDVVETATGAYLHRFQDIPDEQIGELPKTWNTLDWMDDRTKADPLDQRRPVVRANPQLPARRCVAESPRRNAVPRSAAGFGRPDRTARCRRR